MTNKPWTSHDTLRLHETVGQLRLEYGQRWAYFELARLLPNTIEHVVIAAALEGPCPLADAEADTLRRMMATVLATPPTRVDK